MITIHCGTWKRVQDGARIEGQMVQHEGGKMSKHEHKPEQPQGDVIERMMDAYASCAYRTNERDHRNGMTAAAKVLLD